MASNPVPLRAGDALLIVDVQNDFLPGGALAVANGDAVIPPLNRCIEAFNRCGLPVFATRDWHPLNHCSFQVNGGPWPVHCVAGTRGAELAASLRLPPEALLMSKGTSPVREAYSGFQGTDLGVRLRERNCKRVFIGGLATDYCVHATALDALIEGLEVLVIKDAVRPVEAKPGDGEHALEDLNARGVRLIQAEQVLK